MSLADRYEFSPDEFAPDADDRRRCQTCERELAAGELHICEDCLEEVERTIEDRTIEGVPEHVRDRYREMAA